MRKVLYLEIQLNRQEDKEYAEAYFCNLPCSSKLQEHYIPETNNLVDARDLGVMLKFLYALSEPKDNQISIEVILTDKEEKHEKWIELVKDGQGNEYTVHNLDNYIGEFGVWNFGPTIDIQKLYGIPNPKFIYVRTTHQKIKSEYHQNLMETYIYLNVMYSLSFEDQVSMDLRHTNIQISDYDESIDAFSDEEIKKRLESLKRPWWYRFYERRLQKHKVLLFFILVLLYAKNLILWIPRQLYRNVKYSYKQIT